jgi:hypothetical protein
MVIINKKQFCALINFQLLDKLLLLSSFKNVFIKEKADFKYLELSQLTLLTCDMLKI